MALIKAHLAEGNQYEALRLYHNYQRVLQRELGLEPSVAIRSLLPTTNPAKAAHNPGSNLLKVTAG
jgi:DNA-binding SARP family transcriptional activator